MTNFAHQLKGEISRIARKEVRAETQTLKKASAQYRLEITALKRRIASLEASVKKAPGSRAQKPEAVEEGGQSPSLRFRVAGFAALRKKLGQPEKAPEDRTAKPLSASWKSRNCTKCGSSTSDDQMRGHHLADLTPRVVDERLENQGRGVSR